MKVSSTCNIVKGMLCARGVLLLMTDADGATKIRDLEKLETEVIFIQNKCIRNKYCCNLSEDWMHNKEK